MSQRRTIVIGLVIALVSIGVTTLVFMILLPAFGSISGRDVDRSSSSGGTSAEEIPFNANDTVQVIVALQRLPRGFEIPTDALNNAVGIREWPRAAVPVDAIIVENNQDAAAIVRAEIIGKVTRTDIEREQPILRALLADDLSGLSSVGSDTAALLPPGYVAIALPIDQISGVAYGMRPGDTVDVIFSLTVLDVDEEFQTALPNWVFEVQYGSAEGGRTSAAVFPLDGAAIGRVDTIPPGELANIVPSEAQRPRLVSQRAVAGALVMHVGAYPADGRVVGGDIGSSSRDGGDVSLDVTQYIDAPSTPNVITLGVPVQDAVVLTWALNSGVDINLVIRSVQEGQVVQTSSVTLQYIFETYNITVPPRLPYSLEPSLRILLVEDEPTGE